MCFQRDGVPYVGGGVPTVMSEFFSAVFLRGLLPHGDQWKLICSKYQKKVCDSTTVPHGLVCNGMPACREVNLWFVLTPQGRIHTTHNTQASSPHSVKHCIRPREAA